MANTEIIDLIIQTTASAMTYLMPIIGVMTGVVFIVSFLFDVTINAYKKTRR